MKMWRDRAQLTVTGKTLIEVDPAMGDAVWLKKFAQKKKRQTWLGQPFPAGSFYE